VIDRKRIFLFRPKTNIRQENADEYLADNEYSAQRSKHCKKIKLNQKQKSFLGGSCKLQSIVKIYGQQKHTVHKALTMRQIDVSFLEKKWL
jgi:hypothetical protein